MVSPDPGPLTGKLVLDLSQGIAGPHAAMLMAQAGATVIKVEPIDGEWGRTIGKSYGDLAASTYAFNRGKRSLAVDLKHPDGRAAVQKLARQADVVLESFRPGVVARFGLDHASLKDDRPDLVYLSISGFGQSGLYTERPVTDAVIQAFSGWMTVNRDVEGRPQRNDMPVIDIFTGLYGFQAVLMALMDVARTGKGRHIDCNMMQAAAAFQTAKIVGHHLEHGKPSPLYVPSGTVRTADGYMNFAAMHETRFRTLCEILGRPELGSNPDYATGDLRIANSEPLMAAIREAFETRPTSHWQPLLNKAEIQNSPVLDYDGYLADPHVQAVESYDWIDHPSLGRLPLPRTPGLETPPLGAEFCPHVGQHTVQVLRERGFDAQAVADLIASGAVRDGDHTLFDNQD